MWYNGRESEVSGLQLFLKTSDYPAVRTEAERMRLRRLQQKRVACLLTFAVMLVALALGLWYQNQGAFYVATASLLLGLCLLNTRADRYFLVQMTRTELPPPRRIDQAVLEAALWKPTADSQRMFFRFAIGWEVCMLLLPLYAMLCNGVAYVTDNYFGFLVMQLLFLPPSLVMFLYGRLRRCRCRKLVAGDRLHIVEGTVTAVEREEHYERPDSLYLIFYELGEYGIQRLRVNEQQYLCADPGRDKYFLILEKRRGKYRLCAALPSERWML